MESTPLTLLPLLYFFPTSELNRQSMLCCLAWFVLSYRTIAKKIVLGAMYTNSCTFTIQCFLALVHESSELRHTATYVNGYYG